MNECADGRKGTRIGPLQRGGCPAKQTHAKLLRTGSLRANREDVVPNVFEPGPTAQDCVQSLTNSVPYIALGKTLAGDRVKGKLQVSFAFAQHNKVICMKLISEPKV